MDIVSAAQRAELAALFERHNAKGPREVKRLLGLYAAWDTLLWSHLISRDPVEATLASSVLVHGVYDWMPIRRIDALARLSQRWRLRPWLAEALGETCGIDAAMATIEAEVPSPSDLPTALEIVRILHGGVLPWAQGGTRSARDVGFIAPLSEPEELSGCEAARRVRNGDRTLALGLLAANALPPATLALARELAERRGPRAACGPIQALADLPAEMGALVSWAHPPTVSKWDGLERYAYTHVARLARVLGLDGTPTLDPNPDPRLIEKIKIDEDAARAYDEQLLIDAEDRAEQLVEEEGASEDNANRLASNYCMRGWEEFLRYLDRATGLGAQVWDRPKGIASERRRRSKYQGVRPDICPRPELYREFLALAPSLAAGEDLGHQALVQCVSAARQSAVLTIDQSCVIPEKEGLVLHVRVPGNKKGRATLFVASCWVDLYEIHLDWFPRSVTGNPTERDRQRLADTLKRMCRGFSQATGIAIPHRNAGFTRPAYMQMIRPHLGGLDREAATAQLGQKLRTSRGSYFRPYEEDVRSAHGPNWRKGR